MEFETGFELECISNKGKTYYTIIEQTVECGYTSYVEECYGYHTFFEADDTELEQATQDALERFLEDEDACIRCEEMLEDELDEDEHIIEVRDFVVTTHDFEIFFEDLSFDYADEGKCTCNECDVHGFKVKTYGERVDMDSLKGYGYFDNHFKTKKTEQELDGFIEHYKTVSNFDNFTNVCNLVELERLQDLLRKNFK